MIARSLLILCVIAVAAASLVCVFNYRAADEGATITFENALPVTIDVFDPPHLIANGLAPGQRTTYTVPKFDETLTFEARGQDGKLAGSATVTWDQLEDQNFRVVFEHRDQSSGDRGSHPEHSHLRSG